MSKLFSPRDLAGLIRDRWGTAHGDRFVGPFPAPDWGEVVFSPPEWAEQPPPPREVLEELLAHCYQASLLREEQRQVTFRLVLAEPSQLPRDQGPPEGLHCLPFQQTRPLNPLELRRLSPAADFYRSLLGVCWEPEAGLRIWGIIHSGLRWLQNFQGGRGRAQALPPTLVVSVTGPGRLTVGFGSRVIARLEGSQISGLSMDVFASHWFPASFAEVREEIWQMHADGRAKSSQPWAALNPMVIRIIAQHTIKRVISAVRSSQHGATVLILPVELTATCCGLNGFIDVKYKFQDGETRLRFRTLIVRIMERLAELHGALDPTSVVSWTDYVLSNDEKLAGLDEAISEMSYLIAGCAEVDGAVVLNKRFELLGFGGEISGRLPNVSSVRQALDLEGDNHEEESTESVGTRHRSTYRLCQTIPEAIAIVVSQDGNVRFVKNVNGAVTYWDQTSTTPMDV